MPVVASSIATWLLVLGPPCFAGPAVALAVTRPTAGAPAELLLQADADASGVRASWGPTRLEAEIGEPVPWTLEVAHPRRARPTVVSQNLEDQLDRTWAFVSGPEIRTREDGARSEVTTFTWILMALEPGDRTAPALTLATDSGAELEVPSEVLAVRPALAPEEDTPRPLAPFHEVNLGARPSGFVFTALVLLLLGALAAPFVVRWRRARRRAAPSHSGPTLDPASALEALVARRSEDPAVVRTMAFELTGILRRALAAGGPGATDAEWLAAARSRAATEARALDPSVIERVEQIVGACEEIKYGGRVPTRFAVDELLASARTVLKELDEHPAPLLQAAGGVS